MNDQELRATLARLPPSARDELRRLLIRDQASRDGIAEQLLRRRGTRGATELADFIDMLSLDAEARRRVIRVLGELEAAG
jgi:hypothetical protein